MNDKVKSLFFSQYLGQEVFTCNEWLNTITPVDPIYLQCGSNRLHGGYLLLRDISQLEDFELIQIATIWGYKKEYSASDNWMCRSALDILSGFDKNRDRIKMSMVLILTDYLRSIGILLPFTYLSETNQPITLTPADIINLGWAKVKER